jgi:hypothetical protein
LRPGYRSFFILFIVFTFYTCIDPYIPKLDGYNKLLVVEGRITNENISHEIILSRTMQSQNSVPGKVTDAIVYITDEKEIKFPLRNYGNGSYKTDSTLFKGEIGKTYTLHIETKDGKEYLSEPCQMRPVSEIDSVYYEKAVGYTNNQSETHDGINILLDSKSGDGINNYFRWDFVETWKFRVPDIRKFKYISETEIMPVDTEKVFCWKQAKSTKIVFQSFSGQESSDIRKIPVAFIGSELSDRLSIQYSILVKQYAISEKEYRFWNNLKQVNETAGGIYSSQPFSVISNIYNLKDRNERVLGYFQVSGASQKRLNISFMELLKFNLPLYHYPCKRIESAPEDYACQFCVPPTWDELNIMWTDAGYIFVEPEFISGTTKLRHLVFTTPVCADCSLSGTTVKPDFWVEVK